MRRHVRDVDIRHRDVDDWRMWQPVRNRRVLHCKFCWWKPIIWRGSSYRIEPRSGWYTRDRPLCFCIYYDPFGRILRDAHSRAGTRIVYVPTGEQFEVDYLHGHGSLLVTDIEHQYEVNVDYFDVIAVQSLLALSRRWRREAARRAALWRKSLIPDAVKSYLRIGDVVCFCSACRGCVRSVSRKASCEKIYFEELEGVEGVEICDLLRVIWCERQVVKRFTLNDMLRHDPHYAHTILYVSPGDRVQVVHWSAPANVDPAGWLWAHECNPDILVSGWIHPDILE